MARQRPPWESSQVTRDELSTVLSNRSAAYFEGGDHLSALVDAETVIQIRRPWSKGYFRKAKALIKLEQFHDAKETIETGLIYEPDNTVRATFSFTIFADTQEFFCSGNAPSACNY
jgi:translocation protein SEC72